MTAIINLDGKGAANAQTLATSSSGQRGSPPHAWPRVNQLPKRVQLAGEEGIVFVYAKEPTAMSSLDNLLLTNGR
jgi:hypothetical protein